MRIYRTIGDVVLGVGEGGHLLLATRGTPPGKEARLRKADIKALIYDLQLWHTCEKRAKKEKP